jgi:hypothetical protein
MREFASDAVDADERASWDRIMRWHSLPPHARKRPPNAVRVEDIPFPAVEDIDPADFPELRFQL